MASAGQPRFPTELWFAYLIMSSLLMLLMGGISAASIEVRTQGGFWLAMMGFAGFSHCLFLWARRELVSVGGSGQHTPSFLIMSCGGVIDPRETAEGKACDLGCAHTLREINEAADDAGRWNGTNMVFLAFSVLPLFIPGLARPVSFALAVLAFAGIIAYAWWRTIAALNGKPRTHIKK